MSRALIGFLFVLACGDSTELQDGGGTDGGGDGGGTDGGMDAPQADAASDAPLADDANGDAGDDTRDSATDGMFDASTPDAPDSSVETATRLMSWNDGAGVRVVSPSGSALDGYVRGGDFDRPIWAADDVWSWFMLHITEGGSPTEDFARVSIPVLPDRNAESAMVLRMALLRDAPDTSVEQIEFLEQQSAGRAGDADENFPSHTLVEPVFYQRQWIKFSRDTRDRADAIGERAFYQIFWEMKAEPDYRLRVQLEYRDAIGLVIRAHDDVLSNSDPVHVDSGAVAVGTIEMAQEDQSLGWHLFEVWIDRTRGDASRWRVRFNGIDVIDYTGTLMGSSGNIMGTAMLVQIYSDVTDLSTSPFSQLIDDMEIWDSPPAGAFR